MLQRKIEKMNRMPKVYPLIFVGVGISLALISFATKGSFEPFTLLGFILIAFFELFFKKQNRIPSIILSLICSLMVVFSLKMFVIDFTVMMHPITELGINKSARIFYQPALFSLKDEDKVIYIAADSKYYVAVFKGRTASLAKIYLPNKKQIIEVPLSQIKGKIIYIAQKE